MIKPNAVARWSVSREVSFLAASDQIVEPDSAFEGGAYVDISSLLDRENGCSIHMSE
jgi:hypothetical protein